MSTTRAVHRNLARSALRARVGFAPALAALLTSGTLAQEPSAESDAPAGAQAPQAVEEVIVRGRRLDEIEFDLQAYVLEFLDVVTAPARSRGYARWDRRVCIGVHNLENTAAQYIADRVSSLALDVGLEPGEPGCRPDVNIIFAVDAREMASRLVESQPEAFRPAGGHAGMDLGLAALDDFVQSERAVRWWHVSLPVDARTGAAAIELPQTKGHCGALHCPPQIAVAGPSRIHSGIRDVLHSVIIIVDTTKLAGTTWQQLGDYLAVVSLAQIDPQTDPSAFDSILNLFSNPAAYSGLTDWDLSFIHALYAFDQEREPWAQRSEIASRIARRERQAAAD
ncbi:MAG TPA: hypothetical protein VF339_19105 [Gammaproteobacteria bacterium]